MSTEFDPNLHHRRSVRLRWYDYARKGMYFLTICTQEKRCLFGAVENRSMLLNEAGECIAGVWNEIPARFPNVELDYFAVMPNHIHGIIWIVRRGDHEDRPYGGMMAGEHEVRPYTAEQGDRRGEPCVRPIDDPEHSRPAGTLPGSLARIIQAYKSLTTAAYISGVKHRGWMPFPGRLWQRNYFEHVIRNERELYFIRRYIFDNPRRWDTDRNNPSAANPEDSIPWEE